MLPCIHPEDNTRIHEISEASPWPCELQDVTGHLACALAPISNAAANRLSPFSRKIYASEVITSPRLVAFQDCPQHASVTDVLDTLLLTVHMLREYTTADVGNFTPRPTYPIWMPLLTALALGCSPNAEVL